MADVTEDNANVWYELGYAFASKKSVVMVCSNDRKNKYPFDIQHRSVIGYKTEDISDFEKLKNDITGKLKAILEKNSMAQFSSIEERALQCALSMLELRILELIAGELVSSSEYTSVYGIKNDAQKYGFESLGFNLAYRKLIEMGLICDKDIDDGFHHEGSYRAVSVTDDGWKWIEENKSIFSLVKKPIKNEIRDDIPF